MGLIGALGGACCGLVRAALRGAALRFDPGWTGLLVGFGAALAVDRGERWFTRPPPFVTPPPLHGSVPVFFGIVLLVGLLGLAFARFTPAGRPRLALSLLLLIGLGGWAASRGRELPPLGQARPDARDLILVTMDTTRADHLSAYSGVERQSPEFDRFAASAVRFRSAYSQIAVTGPSHTTILSGQGPWAHGALLNGVPVMPEVPLLADELRRAGWDTGAFVSAYVLDRTVGLDRGFAVYDDDFGLLGGWSRTAPGRLLAMAERHLRPNAVLERRGDRSTDLALSWLEDRAPDRPVFLWLHLFDPHGPYSPPPPWDTAWYEGDPTDPQNRSMERVQNVAPYLLPSLKGITDSRWPLAQYQGEVSYADQQLGRLLHALEASGRAGSAVVIVAADHGENLGEHEVWFNHGDDLYEPSTHVPLAIRAPGTLPSGVAVDGIAELGDIAPTAYELLGLPIPAGVEGRSLAPLAFGRPGREFARSLCFDREANLQGRARGELSQPQYRMVALRSAAQRYVWREAAGFGAALYDLTADPEELRPVGAPEDVVGPLRAEAERLVGGMKADAVERSGAELDPETRERLEALGYMQ